MAEVYRLRTDPAHTAPAVPLAEYQSGGTAVQLEAGDDARLLIPHLGALRRIDIAFSKFREGRGYSSARILREAVSNIIKHSGASHCKVRTSVDGAHFGLLVQDNGIGIAMELDGKLDRGHGMSSMKHRAKQLAGQCLVESGPGYGTVIRLTIPL
jgi:signal transduction histidine kinase